MLTRSDIVRRPDRHDTVEALPIKEVEVVDTVRKRLPEIGDGGSSSKALACEASCVEDHRCRQGAHIFPPGSALTSPSAGWGPAVAIVKWHKQVLVCYQSIALALLGDGDVNVSSHGVGNRAGIVASGPPKLAGAHERV